MLIFSFVLILICVFRLEVHLAKIDSSHWPELVRGDTRGTRIFSAEQMSKISNQLEKFTSDKVRGCFLVAKILPAFLILILSCLPVYGQSSAHVQCDPFAKGLQPQK